MKMQRHGISSVSFVLTDGVNIGTGISKSKSIRKMRIFCRCRGAQLYGAHFMNNLKIGAVVLLLVFVIKRRPLSSLIPTAWDRFVYHLSQLLALCEAKTRESLAVGENLRICAETELCASAREGRT